MIRVMTPRFMLAIALSVMEMNVGVSTTKTERTSGQLYDFVDWCIQYNQLSSSEQHTVNALLEVSGTDNCQDSSHYLLSLTTLDLSDRQIESLAPLSGFDQLQSLYLGQNQITDLSPLESLQQLTRLYLANNRIADVGSISQLDNLTTLSLDNNEIQDLTPLAYLRSLTILYANGNRIERLDSLANLPSLTELYVAHNQINDIQPIESLHQVTHLDLSNNQIAAIEPLSALINLTHLNLQDNEIARFDFLSSLRQLTILDLRLNPVVRKVCPVNPATVCLFTDDAAELYQLGQRQIDRGEFSEALRTFRTAMNVYRTNGDRLRESDTFDRIGNVYDALGQYANALDAYREGLTLATVLGDRQGESETLTHLGVTYIRIGQLERAIETLQQALEIYQNLGDGARDWRRQDPPDGLIFSGLALAHRKQDNPIQALRFAKQSLAHYRNRYRETQTGEAIALARVGEAYLDLSNLDTDDTQLYLEKARLYLEKALNLSQDHDNQAGIARSLHGLGRLSDRLGNVTTALDYYQQAQELRNALDDAAGEGETLNAMGELLLKTENHTEAAAVLQSAVELWESLRPGLTDANKISIAETQAHTYQLLQKSLVSLGDIEAALETSERGRARAFAELLAHRLALRGQSPPPEKFHAPTLTEIQHIAQTQNATLVEYSLIGEELYIWVVEPTGNVHFRRQPFTEKSLSDWVAELRSALGAGERGIEILFDESLGESEAGSIHKTLHALHKLLIEPIVDVFPAGQDTAINAPIIIIPQGELFLVPFPALTDGEGAELIEKYSLLFAPAISFLETTPARQASFQIGSDPALVVGNPVMPNIPTTATPLPPLAGAEREAREIAPILNTQPLIGDDATKSAVVSTLDDVAIAHFATHGLLDDFGTSIPGALALTPTSSSSTDSGFLTAAEISELPINAQLVVLSACDTGQGTITGDGVVGLSRSFLTAGVENVVVSLWSVEDDSTAYLMTEFYHQLQHVGNPAIALRQAMLDTRQQYPNPSQWAAFVLFSSTP